MPLYTLLRTPNASLFYITIILILNILSRILAFGLAFCISEHQHYFLKILTKMKAASKIPAGDPVPGLDLYLFDTAFAHC
jgi:hypothetical protein